MRQCPRILWSRSRQERGSESLDKLLLYSIFHNMTEIFLIRKNNNMDPLTFMFIVMGIIGGLITLWIKLTERRYQKSGVQQV